MKKFFLTQYKRFFSAWFKEAVRLCFFSKEYHLLPLAVYCEYFLFKGLHVQRSLSIVFKSSNVGLYYLAKYYLLKGRVDDSKQCLSRLMDQRPDFSDAYHLAAILAKMEDQESVFFEAMLDHTASYPLRLKNWLTLANVCQHKEHYEQLYALYLQCTKRHDGLRKNASLLDYIATAALNAKCDGKAASLWKEWSLDALNYTKLSAGDSSPVFTVANANEALLHLKQVFDSASIQFFLVSGTLLGVLREGSILPHDKDLDIGVFNTQSLLDIKRALLNSGFFYIRHSRSSLTLKVKHLTGINIDVFVHTPTQDGWVVHEVNSLKWRNQLFTLSPVMYLGQQFLAPYPPERYLTENYNDWRVPQISFDCMYDTPNAVVNSKEEVLAYSWKKIFMLKQRYTIQGLDVDNCFKLKGFEAPLRFLQQNGEL